MRIAIDAAQAAQDKKTGIEYFSYQLIDNILKYDKKNEYFILSNKKVRFNSKNYKLILSSRKRFWNKFRLPLLLMKGRYDAFLEPGYMLPSYTPKNCLTYVHDLGFKHFPECYSIKNRLLQESALKVAVKKAKAILFLTESSKADFKKFYPNFRRRMQVTGLSINNSRFDNILSKRPIKDDYILFVGRLEKKKNILNLIKAFSLLANDESFKHKLVLAGKPGFGFEQIKKEIKKLNLGNKVIITGYVSDEALSGYYKHASLFVFPSNYEGFGIPILEAFASGVPVICSKSSSLPEVACKAAKYFNPVKPAQMAEVIKEVLKSKIEKERLVKLGKERARAYSWEKTAKSVIEIFNSLDEKK